MKDLAAQAGRGPILIHLSDDDVTFVNGGDHRLLSVLAETGAAMVYSDFLRLPTAAAILCPTG